MEVKGCCVTVYSGRVSRRPLLYTHTPPPGAGRKSAHTHTHLKRLAGPLAVVVVEELHDVQQQEEGVSERLGGRMATPLVALSNGDRKPLQPITFRFRGGWG